MSEANTKPYFGIFNGPFFFAASKSDCLSKLFNRDSVDLTLESMPGFTAFPRKETTS